jgi:signal transduction histidine kinase
MDAETKDCMNRIASSAKRMDRLITGALSYSKTVQTELRVGAVDAAGLLRGIIESFPSLQPPNARIEITTEIPGALGNEAGLTQCFSNLLDNAVKFVKTGVVAEVNIRSETRDGFVRIWFEDNGIGIPELFRPRLFQMFQRADKDYDGTGIGLALVRKVAERMGGSVGVEPGTEKGSRFWLELRLANFGTQSEKMSQTTNQAVRNGNDECLQASSKSRVSTRTN